ncbi:hypothetical protein RUND412_008013 [Rhizina undulata]
MSPPPSSFSESDLDLRALSYLTSVDDNLCCPICHAPLINPVNTSCRHTFCAACIAEALRCSQTCPVDRKPLRSEDLTAAPIMIANLVNDLIVICPNSEIGCPASCPRHLMGGHLREDCKYVPVKCSGCEESIARKNANTECLHKLVECEYCSMSVRKLDMEDHKTQCPNIFDDCRHCMQEFPRSCIIQHEATCDAAIIACAASDVGCPWSGPRRELSEHTTVCAFNLLRPVLQSHVNRLEALELENKTLRRRLDILLPPLPANNPNANDSSIEDQTIYLLTEQERLRTDMDRLSASMGEMKIEQSMQLMSESARIMEDLAAIRGAITGMRIQMHWLLTTRLHNTEQRHVNGGANSSNNTNSQSRSTGDNGGISSAQRLNDSLVDRTKL